MHSAFTPPSRVAATPSHDVVTAPAPPPVAVSFCQLTPSPTPHCLVTTPMYEALQAHPLLPAHAPNSSPWAKSVSQGGKPPPSPQAVSPYVASYRHPGGALEQYVPSSISPRPSSPCTGMYPPLSPLPTSQVTPLSPTVAYLLPSPLLPLRAVPVLAAGDVSSPSPRLAHVATRRRHPRMTPQPLSLRPTARGAVARPVGAATGRPARKRRRVRDVQSRKRQRVTPTLPLDVWTHIAPHLNPRDLCTLAQTCQTLQCIVSTTLHRRLLKALDLSSGTSSTMAKPVFIAVTRLAQAPSLRAARLCAQLQRLLGARGHVPVLSARHAMLLRGDYVRGEISSSGMMIGSGTNAPGGGATTPMSLRDVLAAAAAEPGGLPSWAQRAMATARADVRAHQALQRGRAEVGRIAVRHKTSLSEVETLLPADGLTSALRAGVIANGRRGAAVKRTAFVAKVCARLGPLVKCLLLSDGHARLKARRVVGRVLRDGAMDDQAVAQTGTALRRALWWASATANVRRTREMTEQGLLTREAQ